MNADNWKFDDAPNTACFTTTFVLSGSPILRVCHDYSGDWQFHGGPDEVPSMDVAKLVGLKSIVDMDKTVEEIHDLPYGWRAERSAVGEPWSCHKDNPFPTFDEDGYYLEDAVWLSQYLKDITPPSEEQLESLGVGHFAKLVFRFRPEDSEREDYDCERMWVKVTEIDDDGNYVGVLENDPQHDAAALGDVLHFHPLQIADIAEFD